MTIAELRAAVLEPDLCTSCGACQLACPPAAIEFDGLTPRAVAGWQDEDCGSCTDCLDTCPGADPQTAAAEQRLFGRTRTAPERWLGIFQTVVGGRSALPEVFAASASGGSITALLQASIAELGVDVVLTMGRDPAQPWRAAPVLTYSAPGLIETTQSTYQLAPYLGALRALLDRRPDCRVAMTGVACHIQAMRKLQAMDTDIGRWARDHVVFLVEPACSSSTRPEGTISIVERLAGVRLDTVTRLRYREGDYPGGVQVRTRDGGDHRVEFWRAVRELATNKTHRCLSCGDWMSGLADVSVSDGDPNIFAASVGEGAVAKHGRVFVRTRTGARVVDAATAQGLFIQWPIELTGMNLGLERKRNRRASYERSAGPIPLGPIPGYREELEIIPDTELLAVPARPARPVWALVADGSQGARTVAVEPRPPAAGQLRIAATCSLVSPGTELHYLDLSRRTGQRFPLGYCSAGTVEQVGAQVPGFRPGDRVIAMGWGHAVHGDMITVPYRLCRAVPDSIELSDAVVANLAATAVHAVDRSGLATGDEVLVIGAGIVGQLVAQVAAARAARVTIVDNQPERLASAAGLGVHLCAGDALGSLGEPPPGPATRRAFLCVTGEATGAVTSAAAWLSRAAGRPVLVAVGRFTARVDFSVELGNLDLRYAARCGAGYRDEEYAHGRREVLPPPGEATVETNLQRALDLVGAGVVRPGAMALTTMPVEQADRAYTLLRQRAGIVSAIFTYGGVR